MCLSRLLLSRNNMPRYVPCGRCPECVSLFSQVWALRCVLEAQQYRHNCFVTLTYADAPPEGVIKRDLQLFFKRLRRALGTECPIRYFACGEYGKRGLRPHYHVLIFGWSPDDLEFFQITSKGEKLYRSAFLESLWTFGFSSVGELTYDSCKYSSLYLQKFNRCPDGANKPFRLMSLKPGIGFNAITPELLKLGAVYYRGVRYPLPRYFLDVLERQGFDVSSYISLRKRVSQLESYSSSPDDLLVRSKKYSKFFL
ncbi:replication initiator protein [Dipodfec virus UOA04_Rod_1027]|nr:replication initiator protein [Dipodfec virus UOA04_Rod_1027]